MKSIFTFLFTVSMVWACSAQQPAQYSMYMLNRYSFNPAYAGLDNSLSMNGVYRNQWVGLEGHPETQNLNAHMPLYIVGGGVGLSMENESIGSWKQTSVALGYAYQKPVGKSGILSIGLNAGFVQRQLDGTKVKTPGTIFNSENNAIDHNDPYLFTTAEGGIGPTAAAGLYYRGEKLAFGVSAVNLLGNEISLASVRYGQERTYMVFLGYQVELNQSLTLQPSFLVKSDVQQTQIDFSVLGKYNENIFAGVSFRGYQHENIDAIALMGGFKLSGKTTIGYAYDLGLSKLKTVNNGSHEVWLNYNLGKPIGKGRPPHIIYNPRSL